MFSPDLSVPGNCRFYTALGFACFDDTDWTRVLDGIRRYNDAHFDRTIRMLILETHGTNGNGLKLQRSKKPGAERSYISVGALQERLEPEGLRYIIISACNSGRLLRPSIYWNLDPKPGDKLFLPATCGIVGASPDWNPDGSGITIITPASSQKEMTIVGSISELNPVARQVLTDSALAAGIKLPKKFAISDLMMQMITGDDRLRLERGREVEKISPRREPQRVSEALFARFLLEINNRAAREEALRVAGK